jgi:hypothetical protein
MSAFPKALAGAAALLCLLGSAGLSARILDARAAGGTAGRGEGGSAGLLAEISRRPAFAFGFRNFMADIVWLEAVQIPASRRMPPAEYDRLYSLLNVVANYDPRFDVPYIVGGLILGQSPAHAREALAILGRGRAACPGDWRFPFYIGYTQYFSLGNPLDGGRAMADASRLPGSPEYLPRLASRMLSEGRDPETAISLLRTMLDNETDEGRREILMQRLRDVVVERDVQVLERAVAEYRRRTGAPPAALADLVGAGLAAEVPKEPNGGRYVLLPGGAVTSDAATGRLRVFRAP